MKEGEKEKEGEKREEERKEKERERRERERERGERERERERESALGESSINTASPVATSCARWGEYRFRTLVPENEIVVFYKNRKSAHEKLKVWPTNNKANLENCKFSWV